MSVFEQVQSHSMCCRIPGCRWGGKSKDIVQHFDLLHKNQICKAGSDSYIEMNFYDLQNSKPFLLVTKSGIYWFAMNEQEQRSKYITRGIFAIGDSERIQYYIKLGQLTTRRKDILGPFQIHEENSNQYDYQILIEYYERLKDSIKPKMIIYFGELKKETDELNAYAMAQLRSRNSFDYLDSCNYATFVCSGCIKLIRGDPFYWKNDYYFCTRCHDVVNLYVKPEIKNIM